jgi:hypothetical protein
MRMISKRTADRVFRSASNESRERPFAWSIRAHAASRMMTSVWRSRLIDQTCGAENLLTPRGGRAVSNAATRRDPDLPMHESRELVFQQVKLRALRAGVVAPELDQKLDLFLGPWVAL